MSEEQLTVPDQIRAALSKGARMSLPELSEFYCWNAEDKQSARVSLNNMRQRGETRSDADNGVVLHWLNPKHEGRAAQKKAARTAQHAKAAADAAAEKNDEPNYCGQADLVEDGTEHTSSDVAGQREYVVDVRKVVEPPRRMIDVVTDLGSSEIQRRTIAEFVPATVGVRVMSHRNGDMTIETTRGHFGQERVQIPRKHVAALIETLTQFSVGVQVKL